MTDMRRKFLRAGAAVLALGAIAAAAPGTAAADASDDYPIPHRIIVTTCTAEQILAAARDYRPVYYQRYIIDKHNKPPEVQQAAIDSAHYFFSLSAEDRRAYSEQMATNVADQMTLAWPNWAKISTTRASRPSQPTTAPSTHPTTCHCGTGSGNPSIE